MVGATSLLGPLRLPRYSGCPPVDTALPARAWYQVRFHLLHLGCRCATGNRAAAAARLSKHQAFWENRCAVVIVATDKGTWRCRCAVAAAVLRLRAGAATQASHARRFPCVDDRQAPPLTLCVLLCCARPVASLPLHVSQCGCRAAAWGCCGPPVCQRAMHLLVGAAAVCVRFAHVTVEPCESLDEDPNGQRLRLIPL